MVTVRRLVECQSVLLLGQNSKSDPISANFVEGNFVSTAHHPSGCARVPPRSPVNGTNCTHPLRRTTHCDSVNRRVVPLKTRRGRDNDPCFSAGAAVACVSSTFRG
ncbi:hypothetical protein Y032_0006g2935 [Ancylostoma ceylanicum]|uniref:Uncharacterized protein n=1 Tax=Ancylostoma ceylanicum TaxID=53326 RepID=A0A016VRE5_9BILA|nr:hypothetical protein Y032_0006g2935 [Ancylostoma ceylanicum]